MTDYGELANKLVHDAITNKLPGLTVNVTFQHLTGEGEYDAETDTINHVYTPDGPHKAVAAKPTVDDMDTMGVEANNTKLLVPGLQLLLPPDVADHVIINGVKWEIKKTKSVPGESLWIVFIRQT